jgi:hypothetical protein
MFNRLVAAAENGDLVLIKSLINNRDHSETLEELMLERAAVNGHLHVVKYLANFFGLQKRELSIKNANNYKNYVCIYQALISSIVNGHLEVMEYLLGFGYEIDKNDVTIFKQSVVNNKINSIKYLVSIGFDPSLDNNFALVYYTKQNNLEMVKYFISIGCDPIANNDYALRCAAKFYNLELLKFFLSMGCNPYRLLCSYIHYYKIHMLLFTNLEKRLQYSYLYRYPEHKDERMMVRRRITCGKNLKKISPLKKILRPTSQHAQLIFI